MAALNSAGSATDGMHIRDVLRYSALTVVLVGSGN